MIKFKEFYGKRENFKVCNYTNYIKSSISDLIKSDCQVVGYYAYDEKNKILGYIESPQDTRDFCITEDDDDNSVAIISGFFLNPMNSSKTNDKVIQNLLSMIERYFSVYDICFTFDIDDKNEWMNENVFKKLESRFYNMHSIETLDEKYLTFTSHFDIRSKSYNSIEFCSNSFKLRQ